MAAPVYDNSINAWSASNVASLTSASFAIGGTNRFLVAFISSGAGSPADPSGMKWGGSGGTAMTKQGTTLTFDTFFKHSCYTLLNPTAQTSTLYGNWPSNQDETIIACVSATGVDQTTPLGTIATNTGTSEAVSVNATTVADDFVVDGLWVGTTGGTLSRTLTVGANQTARQVVDGANPSIYETFGCSTEVATGTTTTMSWTISGTGGVGGWGIFAVPLKPAASGTVYELDMAPASVAVTPVDVGLSFGGATYTLDVAHASMAVSAVAMGLLVDGVLDVAPASVALTPVDVALTTDEDLVETGLDFPSNPDVADGDTVRFKFTNPHSNGLPIYGASGAGVTYIWRYKPRQQTGYYTTFFWANDDGAGDISTFLWDGGGANTYYGAHPYPPGGAGGTTHDWEISVDAIDETNGTVVKDQWYTQAFRAWGAVDANKEHEFYWDIPNVDAGHKVTHQSNTWQNNTNPPSPALTFGDAPWQPGREMCSGILRGLQIYSTLLTEEEILAEIAEPLSTVNGAANIWYLNLNPTPTDISDKSGNGNDPAWVGGLRPTLYSSTIYQLNVSPASVALTPVDLDLAADVELLIDPASVALSPVDVGLVGSYQMDLAPASVGLAPVDVGPVADRKIDLAHATIAVNAVDLAASQAATLAVTPSSIALTSMDLDQLSARVLDLTPSGVALSPLDQDLTYSGAAGVYELDLAPASVTLTPFDLALPADAVMVVGSSSVAVTGAALDALSAMVLAVSSASVALTPNGLGLLGQMALDLAPSSVAPTLMDWDFTVGVPGAYELDIAPAAVALTPSIVEGLGQFSFDLTPGAVTGTPGSIGWLGQFLIDLGPVPVVATPLEVGSVAPYVLIVADQALAVAEPSAQGLAVAEPTGEQLEV